jgi:hypothetical protein
MNYDAMIKAVERIEAAYRKFGKTKDAESARRHIEILKKKKESERNE